MTTSDPTPSTTEPNPTTDPGQTVDAAMVPGGRAAKPSKRMTAAEAFEDAKLAIGYLYRQGEGALNGYMEARAMQERAKEAAALAVDPAAEVKALRARVHDVEEALVGFRDERNEWRERAEAAEARVRVLEEALRPFAKAWDACEAVGPEIGYADPRAKAYVAEHPAGRHQALFIYDDLRRARATLTPPQDEPKQEGATLPPRDDMEGLGDVG